LFSPLERGFVSCHASEAKKQAPPAAHQEKERRGQLPLHERNETIAQGKNRITVYSIAKTFRAAAVVHSRIRIMDYTLILHFNEEEKVLTNERGGIKTKVRL
jgi:hypothetical protein